MGSGRGKDGLVSKITKKTKKKTKQTKQNRNDYIKMSGNLEIYLRKLLDCSFREKLSRVGQKTHKLPPWLTFFPFVFRSKPLVQVT